MGLTSQKSTRTLNSHGKGLGHHGAIRSRVLAGVTMAVIITITFTTSFGPVKNAHAATSAKCDCVIFRFDDIQDSWLGNVQATVLDTFINSDTKVTPAIIMNSYGIDSTVVDKVQEGKDTGLFELALHGWNHVDYATLSLADQKKTLADANNKLERIHGEKSNIFVTPYNSLNADTLTAMKEDGLRILSADLVDDNGFLPETFPAVDPSGVTSIPYTVYYVNEEEPQGHNAKSFEQLYSEVNDSIDAHGFAVVMLHPPDFAEHSSDKVDKDNSGDTALNIVNNGQLDTLKTLIQKIKSDGKSIVSFNDLASSSEEKSTSAHVADRQMPLSKARVHASFLGESAGSDHSHAAITDDDRGGWTLHLGIASPVHTDSDKDNRFGR